MCGLSFQNLLNDGGRALGSGLASRELVANLGQPGLHPFARGPIRQQPARLGGDPLSRHFALKLAGVDPGGAAMRGLRERILALATGGAASEPGILTSLRHHQAIATALAALGDAAQANSNAIPHEMILLDLYRALWALDSLTGQTTSDDILNLIFSTFCIGK
jgi:hypothetical protein